MSTKTKQKLQVKKNKVSWIRKLKLNNWLAIFGGLILFSSWIVEKKFQSKWTDEKENLKRSQLVIDITENQRSIYEIAYFSETQKKVPDTLLIAQYQQRLARVYMDLLSWSKGRIIDNSKEYSEIIESKRKIDEQNRNCFKNGDFKTINTNFNVVALVFGNFYLKLDNDFSTKVDEVNSKEEYWTSIFTWLYILGSLFVGLSYILEVLRKAEN